MKSRTMIGVSVWAALLLLGNPARAVEGGGVAQRFTGMRLVEPVRLAAQSGVALSNQVVAARALLARFSKAGFRAVWAVDALPTDPKKLEEWTGACLAAFPEPPVLALDVRLEGTALRPDSAAWRGFLALALPRVHSVVLNYTSLDNYACVENEAQAIAAAKGLAALARELSSKTFLWLFLDDDPASAGRIPAWGKELGASVDGYYLYFGHGLSAMADEGLRRAAGPLLASGKPVIRGGFSYAAPRVRPGLEQDIREQYAGRMDRYEAWLATARYAGYSRLLGKSIPDGVSPNLAYLPDEVRVGPANGR